MNLECGACRVRDWRLSDKPSLLRHANNRNVWINLAHRFPHPYTDADADSWFVMLAHETEPTHWAIEVDGAAVGGIGIDLREGIFAKSAGLGYWLGEPFWNRGIMSAAVRGTVEHIFATTGLVRLDSPVFAWNPSSMRVLEKCGFVREGVARNSVFKDGQLIDSHMFACLK